jgi:hypothetical protein
MSLKVGYENSQKLFYCSRIVEFFLFFFFLQFRKKVFNLFLISRFFWNFYDIVNERIKIETYGINFNKIVPEMFYLSEISFLAEF